MLLGENIRRHKVFANTPKGFFALAAWLTDQHTDRPHVCMEATGQYHLPLAEFLHARDHTVSVMNPARTKAYALSRMSRNKTDKTDAL